MVGGIYMTPNDLPARRLYLFQNYPECMEDKIEEGEYRDLTEFSVFSSHDQIV